MEHQILLCQELSSFLHYFVILLITLCWKCASSRCTHAWISSIVVIILICKHGIHFGFRAFCVWITCSTIFKIIACRWRSRYLLDWFFIRTKVISFLIEWALVNSILMSNLLHLRQSMRLHSVFFFHALTHQTHVLQKWVLRNNLILVKCRLSTTHCLVPIRGFDMLKLSLSLLLLESFASMALSSKKGILLGS